MQNKRNSVQQLSNEIDNHNHVPAMKKPSSAVNKPADKYHDDPDYRAERDQAVEDARRKN